MKNKFFLIIFSVLLLLPISVRAIEPNIADNIETPVTEEVLQTQQLDEDIQQETAQIETQNTDFAYKHPFSKRKLIKKFLLAMFAVVVSSAGLYLGLTLYNRMRNNFAKPAKTPKGETSLETPDDIEGAVKTFLEKTKWS